MATFCPYCDEEIEDEIYKFWTGRYWTEASFQCQKCHKKMNIEVKRAVRFIASEINP